MFVSYNKVRLHDTDMAGILYFASLFRFVQDALEDFFESEGFALKAIFEEKKFASVIVHSEADYMKMLKLGDELQVHVSTEKIGISSFTLSYAIFKGEDELMATAKTVQVFLVPSSSQKCPIPTAIRMRLEKHLT